MDMPVSPQPRKGRGAASNASGRFESEERVAFDDGWINPYRGCEHGCIYCFARPSHAYLGLSPGLDFETRIFYKPQSAALLAAELRKKGYTCRPLALGSNTDPYQPAEKRLGITRSILEVLRDFRHPVTIVTKGALIQRATWSRAPPPRSAGSRPSLRWPRPECRPGFWRRQ